MDTERRLLNRGFFLKLNIAVTTNHISNFYSAQAINLQSNVVLQNRSRGATLMHPSRSFGHCDLALLRGRGLVSERKKQTDGERPSIALSYSRKSPFPSNETSAKLADWPVILGKPWAARGAEGKLGRAEKRRLFSPQFPLRPTICSGFSGAR